MGKPTEKMVYALSKLGVDSSNMSFEQASEMIGKLKGSVNKEYKPLDTAFVQYQKAPTSTKPQYNPSSQYVSYSKDMFIVLREWLCNQKDAKGKDIPVDDEVIARRAAQLVKIWIKEFEQ
jgi:hypothetical protein